MGPWGNDGDLPIAGDFGPPSAHSEEQPPAESLPNGFHLTVNRGCGPEGDPYGFGEPLIISYRAEQGGTATLYDFDPYIGTRGRVVTRQLGVVLPGFEHRYLGTISAVRGVETLVLRLQTTAGPILARSCSFSVVGVPLDLLRVRTNKGCGTEASFHGGEPASIEYEVDVPVTRVRVYAINPQMGLVEMTPRSLTTSSGRVTLTVGPQRGDAVVVAAAVTPEYGVITSTCAAYLEG